MTDERVVYWIILGLCIGELVLSESIHDVDGMVPSFCLYNITTLHIEGRIYTLFFSLRVHGGKIL